MFFSGYNINIVRIMTYNMKLVFQVHTFDHTLDEQTAELVANTPGVVFHAVGVGNPSHNGQFITAACVTHQYRKCVQASASQLIPLTTVDLILYKLSSLAFCLLLGMQCWIYTELCITTLRGKQLLSDNMP